MSLFRKMILEERWLFLTALLGLFLGLFCQTYGMVMGFSIPPQGSLHKAVSFNFALSIFLFTIAIIFPLTRFSNRSRIFIQCFIIITSIYSFGLETIQHLRGIDPRFPDSGNVIDGILSITFGLVAITMILVFAILAIQFFKFRVYTERPIIVTGIRYGMITVMMAFLSGIWIIAEGGRITGDSGNIIWFHGIGFHGIQLIPLIALFVEKSSIKSRYIHIGGLSWMLSVLLIGIQTVLGKSVFELNVIMIFAYLFLILSSFTLIVSFYLFINHIIKRDSVSENLDRS